MTNTALIHSPLALPLRGGIRQLDLFHFRNYAHLRLKVPLLPVVLTGPNGAGKTNILEALSLLSSNSRGLRGALHADLNQHGAEDPWSVAVKLQNAALMVTLGTGMISSGGKSPLDPLTERRVLRIDGTTVRGPSALSSVLSVVWLTPLMDSLLIGAPENRRRFFDRLASGIDPDHTQRLHHYNHALRQRVLVLKNPPYDPVWLNALEETMAREGIAIAIARWHVISLLTQALEQTIGSFPQAILSMKGTIETWLQEKSALEAEDLLKQTLAQHRDRDAEKGGAVEGPHRSDVEIMYSSKKIPVTQCSTGEQKALLVSIILAFARIQNIRNPSVCLLLLDDVVAHLDQGRRHTLFEEICHLGIQAWMTGTDIEAFIGLKQQAHFLSVKNGQLYETAY